MKNNPVTFSPEDYSFKSNSDVRDESEDIVDDDEDYFVFNSRSRWDLEDYCEHGD